MSDITDVYTDLVQRQDAQDRQRVLVAVNNNRTPRHPHDEVMVPKLTARCPLTRCWQQVGAVGLCYLWLGQPKGAGGGV